MAKVIKKTRRCPVCGYEHEISEFFRDEKEIRKKLSFKKDEEGRKIIKQSESIKVVMHYRQTGEIIDKYKSITEIVEVPVVKEVFDRKETTKGQKTFKKVANQPIGPVKFGGPQEDVSYSGMFCPNCGVFLDIDTCTKITEEKI